MINGKTCHKHTQFSVQVSMSDLALTSSTRLLSRLGVSDDTVSSEHFNKTTIKNTTQYNEQHQNTETGFNI